MPISGDTQLSSLWFSTVNQDTPEKAEIGNLNKCAFLEEHRRIRDDTVVSNVAVRDVWPLLLTGFFSMRWHFTMKHHIASLHDADRDGL